MIKRLGYLAEKLAISHNNGNKTCVEIYTRMIIEEYNEQRETSDDQPPQTIQQIPTPPPELEEPIQQKVRKTVTWAEELEEQE